MNPIKRSRSGRIIALALVLAILGWMSAPQAAAGEDGGSSYCERVALKCISEAVLSGIFTEGATLPVFLSFCLIGYGFCEKYVEQYIRG